MLFNTLPGGVGGDGPWTALGIVRFYSRCKKLKLRGFSIVV